MKKKIATFTFTHHYVSYENRPFEFIRISPESYSQYKKRWKMHERLKMLMPTDVYGYEQAEAHITELKAKGNKRKLFIEIETTTVTRIR